MVAEGRLLVGGIGSWRRGGLWLVVSWFYILYFGLGLPFICWGAVATPGHPHRRPHFVFTDPPLQTAALTAQASHSHHHASPEPAPQSENPADMAGQSVPPALGVTLLLLLFAELALVQNNPRRDFPRLLPHLVAIAAPLLIPTPPPRLLGSA